MSTLQVEPPRRGRSRSPGGRERSRSRGPPIDTSVGDSAPVPYPDDPRGSGPRIYDYGEEGMPYDPYVPPPRSPNIQDAYPRDDDFRSPRGDDMRSPRGDDYRRNVDVRFAEPGGRREKEYRYEEKRDRDSDRERERDRDRARDRDSGRDRDRAPLTPAEDKLAFLPQKYSKSSGGDSRRERDPRARDSDRERDSDRDRKQDRDADRRRPKRYGSDSDDDLAYGKGPIPPASAASSRYAPRPESPPSTYKYAEPKQWEYAKTDQYERNSRDSLGVDPRYSGASIGRDRSPGPSAIKRDRSPGPGSIKRDRSPGPGSRDDDRPRHERTSSANIVTVEPGQRPSAMKRDRSPMPPTARMSSLSVSGPQHGTHLSLAAAPGSPLLESYHGTYQSMSPMPSPMMLPTHGSDPASLNLDPSDFDEPMSPTTERKRRARFTDISDDAAKLAKALKGSGPPDTVPLIELLPGLTHEQIMELRTAYKALVKTGPERKGVNVAKHIRARLKDEDTNLMKACYATALGKWESEAYWANFWYQGDKTRRELLIEALMGRTNAEIRQIKAGFSDKKYDNSLVRCMRQELKEDKFKRAVLMVLDERRMEEYDDRGRLLPIDKGLVEEDARALYKAVRAEKGGETAMIEIVVRRSDAHLREVLRLYATQYKGNFAKDALRKSGNLVGELLAHILNGVINKPVRDALLVHHAVMLGKKDALRRELLISRLVRFHWDRHHMAAVKRAYRDRYDRRDMQDVVREATAGTGGWGEFCRELCVARMPDDVRRFDKVEIIDRR